MYVLIKNQVNQGLRNIKQDYVDIYEAQKSIPFLTKRKICKYKQINNIQNSLRS